eukprot:3659692-Pyramimonas_sp.AAC.1
MDENRGMGDCCVLSRTAPMQQHNTHPNSTIHIHRQPGPHSHQAIQGVKAGGEGGAWRQRNLKTILIPSQDPLDQKGGNGSPGLGW